MSQTGEIWCILCPASKLKRETLVEERVPMLVSRGPDDGAIASRRRRFEMVPGSFTIAQQKPLVDPLAFLPCSTVMEF